MNTLQSDAISIETASRVAAIFTALGDTTRLRILSLLLDGRQSVSDICTAVAMSQPAVSHHLRLLRLARIIRAEKEGKYIYYDLDDAHVRDLIERAIEHIQHE